MGFDENGNLYTVVNRLHNFVAGRLREDEVNFRILRSKTGTLSYVHTGRPNLIEENILNTGNNGPIYETFNNNLGNGINTFGNGISSTTPISLGSVGGQFRNSASTTTTSTTVTFIIATGLLTTMFNYLI